MITKSHLLFWPQPAYIELMTSVKRPTVGIDIDEVLSRSVEGFTAYSNKRWGTIHNAENYDEDWAMFWNVSMKEAQKRADEIYSSGVFSTYQPFEQALPVLRRLSATKDLLVITSRRRSVASETDAWVRSHFPNIFRNIHYAGIWDDTTNVRHKLNQTKADTCRELGVNYLIDDQLKHCIAAAETNIEAILFGNYNWNEISQLPAGVTRAIDWIAVEQYFDAKFRPSEELTML